MTRLLNLLPGAAVIATIASAQEYCVPSTAADYACMMSPAEAVSVHYSAMDDGFVAFMLEVPTEGFIALGSPAEPGVMIGTNAVIGSSTLGAVGYFLGGKGVPLLEQYEIGEGMTVSREAHSIVDGISRLSFTLDPSAIMEGPNEFVYSYKSDGTPDLGYHGSTRGGFSIDFGIGPEPMMDPCETMVCDEGMVCTHIKDADGNFMYADCMPTEGDDDMMDPCHDMECPEGMMCEVKMGENGEMMPECVDGMMDPCHDMECPEGMMCEVKTGTDGEMMAECVKDDDVPPSCEDGMMNGAEEGVDCGGPDCKMCMGEHCAVDDDCAGEGMCVCEPKMDDAPKRLRKHKKSRRHINFYSGGDMDDCFCKKPEDDMMPPMN